MNTIKKLRDAFNWLNEQPKHQYTSLDLIEKLSDGTVGLGAQPFTRAERLTERIITLSGSSLCIAFAIAGAVTAPVALTPLSLIVLALGTGCGMLASKCASQLPAVMVGCGVKFGVGATRLLDRKYNGAEY